MVGYASRQETYTSGDTIQDTDSNNEFNAILSAFDSTTGHNHDGSAGEGSRLVITDTTGGTQYGIPLLNGAGNQVTSSAALTTGQIVLGQSAAVPAPKTMSGDATIIASGALTLANTAVTAASYGSATASPTFTVDSKGRLTLAANVTITPAFSSITSTPTTLAGYGITDAQGLDATLTSIAALGTAANKYLYTTGIDTWAEGSITAAGRAILDDASASAQRTTLGLVIGIDVQAEDATLTSIAALGTAADKMLYTTGINTWAETAITTAGRAILDDASASAQRTTLGLIIGTDVQAYDVDIPTVAASQVEMEAGTETALRSMSPERVKQAIDALAVTSGLTQGTPIATTSGTSIDFTSIPAGTKRILISLSGVSTNGSSLYMIQIGDSGGVETSGYGGLCEGALMSGGFTTNDSVAASNLWQGIIVLTLLDASTFTWSMTGDLARDDAGTIASSAGTKSLSAELDRLRLTTVGGSDTFDAGKINIQYEG